MTSLCPPTRGLRLLGADPEKGWELPGRALLSPGLPSDTFICSTRQRVGYLAASQCFHEGTDVIMLTTNQIRKVGRPCRAPAASSARGRAHWAPCECLCCMLVSLSLTCE